ncbi:MFS transporter [Rathayibacter oskolensis]|uniref:MFS transporter n=1 Tax=Rathayibacter oskolensis TaxID=1891671 RepID=UPI00266052C6|nr:MFS transporter [Rathayibacter oskolensis]WKK72405.1 MFS transporter [Rathayibacter oskolensis]
MTSGVATAATTALPRDVRAPLSGLMIAQFVAGLSATIVATSIPTVMRSLEGAAGLSTWLVAATILGNTATTPLWGRLADLVAPKRILQSAIAVFVAGSVLAALAPSTAVLLTARAVQGIGLGGTAAVSMAAVALLVPLRERGRVNGSLQALQTSATILGPIVGGLVVQSLGWRWCFVVALPLALASFAVLTATLHVRLPVTARGGRTDYAGALLIATGVPSALIALTLLGEGSFGTALVAFAAFGALALVALVIVELKVAAPIIPLRLLGGRVTLVCAVAALLLGSTLFGGSVFVTQYLQIGLGIDPAPAGLLLAPLAVGAVAASWFAGRRITRTGRLKGVLLLAASAMLLGNALLALAPLAPPLGPGRGAAAGRGPRHDAAEPRARRADGRAPRPHGLGQRGRRVLLHPRRHRRPGRLRRGALGPSLGADAGGCLGGGGVRPRAAAGVRAVRGRRGVALGALLLLPRVRLRDLR